MTKEYDKDSAVSEKEIAPEESRFREYLDKGIIRIHRDPWMLDEDYCRSLDTASLAKKCFSDAFFPIEMHYFPSNDADERPG